MPVLTGRPHGLAPTRFCEAESLQAVLPLKIRRLPGDSVAGQTVVG
jgi:hypothetical protein